MKISIPPIGGFAAESASANDRTVKIGFKMNCKDTRLDIKQKLVTTFLDEYVYPDIMYRVKEKKLEKDFKLDRAHIILSDDPTKSEILLNDNVRFLGLLKLTSKERNKGDPILVKDVLDILELYPSKKNDQNAAHVMLLKFNREWLLACDLFYNKEKNKHKLENAKAFLKSGNLALDAKLYGPFVDNLYSATELGIQAILHLRPIKYVGAKAKIHHRTLQSFENYSKLGNLDVRYWENYKKLLGLRSKGRYLNDLNNGKFYLDESTTQGILQTTTQFIEFVEQSLKGLDISPEIEDTEIVAFGTSEL